MITRRSFAAAAGAALAAEKKIRLAVVGGGFGTSFYWHEHPGCTVAAVTDLYAERRTRLRDTYQCDSVYESMEDMLAKRRDLDAIAIFSGAPDHARQAIACMRRGLHVISAVPACLTLAEAAHLKEAKEKTGMRYMMAETSYYRQAAIYAREMYQGGGFGRIHYSEVEYYHDDNREAMIADKGSRYYNPDGSHSWRQMLPPMLYPTHSLGFVVGVSRERITQVSCLGWGDAALIAKFPTNRYKNPHLNQFAQMQTNKGHMVRCNVFWQIAADGERAQWFGDKGSFYMAKTGFHPDMWHPRYGKPQPANVPKYWSTDRLPEKMRHDSGHGGSHTFLADEFIRALLEDREPAIDIYESLAMTVPGIVAHQSAQKSGETMKVPSFDRA
ncbi:MAG: Gfo/Idh/MocA family oxidoreductase [Acidimicrobiia bacterium]|nr:Gfo/Idh/MocA family oxidoreductase [Acidimicrobiia bacterium]